MSEKHPLIGGIVTEVEETGGIIDSVKVSVPNGREYWIGGGYFMINTTRSK